MTDDAPPAITRALRAHIADHNFRVALFTFITLLGAIALWFLLHFTMHWLALLAVTVIRGVDAKAPESIDRVFWWVAAVLLALAWIDRRFRPDERPRDHKSALEIAWEILLAIPRFTFAIGGTLSAWQRFDRHELHTAASLIERLTHEHRMLLHSLPLKIPNGKLRLKVLFALQLMQIIEVRRENRELWIALNPLRPASLQPRRERKTVSF